MNERINKIADEATLLFLRQGYARTQISHIAKAVGVSVGTIYLDFAGKKEIMYFVLKRTIDPDFADRELKKPIADELFAGIEEEVVSLLEQSDYEFAEHLKTADTDYSFESLISDAFDLLARYAVGCLFIEKNQYEFTFLADHYRAYRKNFYENMTKYLRLFIENGTVRQVAHLDLTTTMIIEILTWWVMDRRYVSFEVSEISLETAKAMCLDNILTAYKA